MNAQRGLTLVELLVALGIFALVSAASIAVFSLAIGSRAQLEEATDETMRLERARALIRSDLAQLVPRPVQESGEARASFVGGTAILEGADDETVLMALTRSGWSNPGAARPRAELQRVEYVLREGSLIRRSRPFLDAVEATPRTEQVLLAGVEAADMRFFDGDSWRPGFSAPSGQPGPRAVRLEMIHPRFGPLRQDFLAGPRS
ncbi:type II secretion system minor pseudopilin GspJ [Parvularcula oceani]|uniref:type II secretion system minor pseudopilin GspJ n=1 Tax=Parvularcula oceani TaxID=1247963 RepID=UPI0004E12421|nr:type II secretion system minor pseudopilin GspJ [Parvularcula oceani]